MICSCSETNAQWSELSLYVKTICVISCDQSTVLATFESHYLLSCSAIRALLFLVFFSSFFNFLTFSSSSSSCAFRVFWHWNRSISLHHQQLTSAHEFIIKNPALFFHYSTHDVETICCFFFLIFIWLLRAVMSFSSNKLALTRFSSNISIWLGVDVDGIEQWEHQTSTVLRTKRWQWTNEKKRAWEN